MSWELTSPEKESDTRTYALLRSTKTEVTLSRADSTTWVGSKPYFEEIDFDHKQQRSVCRDTMDDHLIGQIYSIASLKCDQISWTQANFATSGSCKEIGKPHHSHEWKWSPEAENRDEIVARSEGSKWRDCITREESESTH